MAVYLLSHLSIEECRQRMRDATDRQSFNPLDSLRLNKNPVISYLKQNTIQLEKRRSYNNSFAPVLSLDLEPTVNGTLITGSFHIAWFVLLFLVLWFGGFLYLTILIIVRAMAGLPLSADETQPVSIFTAGIPLLFAVGGAGIVAVGKALGKSEETYLVDFVQKTCEAEPALAQSNAHET